MDTNFPLHTKEAWLERVKKELSDGKSLDDLMVSNALYQHDGFAWPHEGNDVDGFLPVSEWNITAPCDSNASCLQALQNGAEALWIQPGKDDLPNDLLAGIHLGYIQTIIDLSSLNHAEKESWIQWINEQSDVNHIIPISDTAHTSCFTLLKSIPATQDGLANLLASIKASWHMQSKGWILTHEIVSDFYGEIAWLRALRILFGNLALQEANTKSMLIMAQPKPTGEDVNQDLIRFTYRILSAVLGGSDFIAGVKWSNGDNQYARWVQNLQHLMKQEGKLHLFRDAMAGSYFIEDITGKLVASTLLKLEN